MDCNLSGSSVHGILQARTLEWGAISFSNAGKWKVKVKSPSRVWLLWPHGLQPIRLLRPWDFPGKSTGVGCHCLLRSWGYSTVKIFHQQLGNICEGKGFPCSSVGKESACNAGDAGSIPGSGRSPGEGNGNPFQYSCLENPMNRGAWQVTIHGVTRVRHDLAINPPSPCKRKYVFSN